jgi:putative transposase
MHISMPRDAMAAPGWLVYGTKLKTREQMRLDVFEYIETWYNHKRRFSALGNLTIDEFWNQYNRKKESIKNVA